MIFSMRWMLVVGVCIMFVCSSCIDRKIKSNAHKNPLEIEAKTNTNKEQKRMLVKQNTVPLKDVLQVYADLTKRTLLIGSQIPAINLEFSSNEIIDNGERLQIIEATLSEHGIVVEDYGSKYAKILRKGGLRSGLIFESIGVRIIEPVGSKKSSVRE